MWFNKYNSLLNFKVHLKKWTLKFKLLYLSERAVTSWIFSNNESNFVQFLRQQFKRFTDECQLPSQYLNWVFKMSTSCHTWSKSLSKWQDCLMNELLWQIIPYRFCSAIFVVFWRVFLIASHGDVVTGVHFGFFVHKVKLCIRLKYQWGYFLCQNRSLITCSLWKMHI